MKPPFRPLAAALLATLIAGPALAASHLPEPVVTRQSLMRLFTHNLALLGGMAQGKIEYDAELAQKAADSIVALTGVDQSRMWPAGTDNFEIEGTRALPELWDNLPDLVERNMKLQEAAVTFAQSAGSGLEAMRGSFGPLVGVCGACHKRYRSSQEQ